MTEFRPAAPSAAAGHIAVTETDEQRIRDALDGLRFPANRHAALAYATDRGVLDGHLLNALAIIPDRTYSGVDDVVVSLPESAPGTVETQGR